MPSVSVIIPCYNADRFVGQAIQSILDQTFQDFEIIVVDDGSTDQTPQIVQNFNDPRLHYLHQENQGPAAARNTGIAAATGEYIAPLDADDLALPHRLAEELEILEKDPALSVVGSGYTWIDEEGQELPWVAHSWQKYPELNNFRDWLFDCPVVPSATMFRRSAWQDVDGFDNALIGPEDWNFWMRLSLQGHRMTWHRNVVCLYRHRPDSLSEDAERMTANCAKAIHRIMAHPDFPPELTDAAHQGLAIRYVDGAKRLFRSDLWEQGGDALEKGLALDPSLMEFKPSRIEDELISAALDPLIPDPIQFLETLFQRLPDNAHSLRKRQQHMITRCYVELLVRDFRSGNLRLFRKRLGPTLARLPGWLLDAGTWAIIVRAIRNRLAAIVDRIRGRR